MSYDAYRIKKYDLCRDGFHAAIACYDYEDDKKLRLLIMGNPLIPTPPNEIRGGHNNVHVVLNTPVEQIPDFLNMLERRSELYLLIDTDRKKIILSTIRDPNNDLHKLLDFY